MDDEDAVSAAADLLCEAALGYAAWGMPDKADRCCKAADAIRARLRDERGDDDTPVDEAWLRSVLPKNASYIGYGHIAMSFRIEYTQLPEGWFHTTTGLPVRTRGDARRLCETFGITLDAAEGE